MYMTVVFRTRARDSNNREQGTILTIKYNIQVDLGRLLHSEGVSLVVYL